MFSVCHEVMCWTTLETLHVVQVMYEAVPTAPTTRSRAKQQVPSDNAQAKQQLARVAKRKAPTSSKDDLEPLNLD